MEVELQQKGASTSIIYILPIGHLVPLIVSVAGYSLSKLSSEKDKSVLNVVAFIVKLAGLKPVLRCSEN